MKILLPLFLATIFIWVCQAEPIVKQIEIKTTDGTVFRGKVSSANAEEVVLTSEFGVLRINTSRLSPETLKLVGVAPLTQDERIQSLIKRIQELETENTDLKKRLAGGSASENHLADPNKLAPSSPQKKPTAAVSYSLSSSGKRHNSSCRYFGSGSACAPTDGVACKICGG